MVSTSRSVILLLVFSATTAATAATVVCRQCGATRASDIVFAPPQTFPGGAKFGPDGKSALDPHQAFVVRVPAATNVLITTSHDASFRSEAAIYIVDRAKPILGLSSLWVSSAAEPSILIANNHPAEAWLLVTTWQAQLVAGNHPDCSACLDLVFLQDRMNVLAQWANLTSLGGDDSGGDGDYNDVIVNATCVDGEVAPPVGVRKIALP